MSFSIDAYAFGRMVVNGREYTSDLIIYPDGRIDGSWWRAQGHSLIPGDIDALLKKAPARLIIGTGVNGYMKVSQTLEDLCGQMGIAMEAFTTPEAVKRFNEAVKEGVNVGACFHLTC